MNKAVLFMGVVGLLAAGGAGFYWYANKPILTYHPNGVLKSEVPQLFLKKNGLYREYDEQSKLILEVPYLDDVKTGVQKEYSSTGIKKETMYVKNQISGMVKTYDDKGQTILEEIFKNNVKTGTEMQFLSDGTRVLTPYVDGKKSGLQQTYSKDNIIQEITYENNVRNGISKKYNDANQLVLEETYKDDIKSGIEKQYLANGKRVETPYVAGKKSGIQKTYVKDSMVSEATYENDVRNGISKIYDEAQQLVQEETYVNNEKTGIEKLYFSMGGRLETPYEAGKKNGKAVYYVNNEEKAFLNYENDVRKGEFQWQGAKGIFVTPNDISLSAGDTDNRIKLTGTIICNDKDLFSAAFNNYEIPNWISLSKCLSLKHIDGKSSDVNVTFDGVFEYPAFPKVSTLDIVYADKFFDKYKEQASTFNVNTDIADYYASPSVRFTVQENNKDVMLDITNKSKQKIYSQRINLNNISDLIETAAYSATNETVTPELIALLKKVELNNFTIFAPSGKPDIQFEGGITPLTAKISPDSAVKMVNLEGKSYLDIKGVGNSINVTLLFPTTNQPLLSFDVSTDLSLLTDLQNRLGEANSTDTYGTLGFMLMGSAAEQSSKEISVRNLVLKDVSGNEVVKAERLDIKPETKEIKGTLTLIGSNGQKTEIVLNGNTETVTVQLSDRAPQQMSLQELRTMTAEMGVDTAIQSIINEFTRQAQTLIDNKHGNLLSGVVSGVKEAQQQLIVNEILGVASKYAVFVQTHHQSYMSTLAQGYEPYSVPDLCATGIVRPTNNGCTVQGATYQVNNIIGNGVQIRINLNDEQLCRNVAATAGLSDTNCTTGGGYLIYSTH